MRPYVYLVFFQLFNFCVHDDPPRYPNPSQPSRSASGCVIATDRTQEWYYVARATDAAACPPAVRKPNEHMVGVRWSSARQDFDGFSFELSLHRSHAVAPSPERWRLLKEAPLPVSGYGKSRVGADHIGGAAGSAATLLLCTYGPCTTICPITFLAITFERTRFSRNFGHPSDPQTKGEEIQPRKKSAYPTLFSRYFGASVKKKS